MGYNLFLEVEKFLKNENWCQYKSNSEILSILNRYQDNLEEHLNNKDVLTLIASKTKAGSLIKITLRNHGDTTKIQMKVVGENGGDVLFKEEKELSSDKENALAGTVVEWLNAYSKTIPYDGRILKVEGDKIVINVGENFGMNTGQYLKIYRPIGKKKHPLLDEVINWEKRELGRAQIVSIRADQSIGEMKEYLSKESPTVDDWAISDDKAPPAPVVAHAKKEQVAKFGYISLALDIGTGSQTLDASYFHNKFSGAMIGARLKGEMWFTENWWMGLDLAARVGNLSPETYNLPDDSETRGYYKIKGGYRFLPTGFFSGPQIDILIGWGGYSYQPDYVEFYGPIDANFYGVLLGVKGGIPIGQYFRTSLYLDFLFSTKKDQEGGPAYFLELAVNYLFKSYLTFDASFSGWGNYWDEIAPGTDIRYKDFSFLLGATYYF